MQISAVAQKGLLQGGNIYLMDIRHLHVAGHSGSDACRFTGDQTGRHDPNRAVDGVVAADAAAGDQDVFQSHRREAAVRNTVAFPLAVPFITGVGIKGALLYAIQLLSLIHI